MKRKLSILISCLLGFSLSPVKSEAKESITMRVERLQLVLNSQDKEGSPHQKEHVTGKDRLLYWNDWRDWNDWPNWNDY
jgi:hypothetical protein